MDARIGSSPARPRGRRVGVGATWAGAGTCTGGQGARGEGNGEEGGASSRGLEGEALREGEWEGERDVERDEV